MSGPGVSTVPVREGYNSAVADPRGTRPVASRCSPRRPARGFGVAGSCAGRPTPKTSRSKRACGSSPPGPRAPAPQLGRPGEHPVGEVTVGPLPDHQPTGGVLHQELARSSEQGRPAPTASISGPESPTPLARRECAYHSNSLAQAAATVSTAISRHRASRVPANRGPSPRADSAPPTPGACRKIPKGPSRVPSAPARGKAWGPAPRGPARMLARRARWSASSCSGSSGSTLAASTPVNGGPGPGRPAPS